MLADLSLRFRQRNPFSILSLSLFSLGCILLFCVALLPAAGYAATGYLNDSGMTQCFDGTTLGPCDPDIATFPGQDGRFGRDIVPTATLSKTGAGAAGFDFTKVSNAGAVLPAGTAMGVTANDWACTRDNVTGLLWAIRDSTSTAQWGDPAVTALINSADTEAIGGTGRCNRTGWRLPTVSELNSIVHHGITSGRHVDVSYFPNVQSSGVNRYWTSIQRADNSAVPCLTLGTCAWSVDFNTGEAISDLKTSAYMIILVNNDGVAPPAPAVTDNGNGTMTDNVTGLIWSKCTQGQTYNTGTLVCDTNILNAAYTWQQALAQANMANAANFLGHNDWRLPNTKELESLMRYNESNPVIDPAFKGANNGTFTGSGAPLGQYWSSTISAVATGQVWYADFRIGGIFRAGRTAALLHVRLVRGGSSFGSYQPPPFAAAVSVSGITNVTATVNGQANLGSSNGYWLIVPAGSVVPTIAEIVNSTYGGPIVAGHSDALPVANTNVPFGPAGLAPNTAYDVYFVAENNGTYVLVQTSFTTLSFAPPDLEGLQTRAEISSSVHGGESVAGFFVPQPAVRGEQGAVFIFAWLPEQITFAPNTIWYFDSAHNWHLFSDCRITPAYFTGTLQALHNIAVVGAPSDLSMFIGTELYIGYGLGGYAAPSGQACNDMLASRNWVKVLTVSSDD